jgi:hypothetical protein
VRLRLQRSPRENRLDRLGEPRHLARDATMVTRSPLAARSRRYFARPLAAAIRRPRRVSYDQRKRPGWRQRETSHDRRRQHSQLRPVPSPGEENVTLLIYELNCVVQSRPAVTPSPPMLRLESMADALSIKFQLSSEGVEAISDRSPDLVSRASVASCRIHCILGRAG